MIRAYQEKDIDQLLEVWYQASSLAHPFLTEDFLAKEKKNIREIYIPNTKTWVFIKEEKLEGFISMIGNEVGAIFVNPAKHGQGMGYQLMNHVKQFYHALEVEVFKENKIGRTFYDKYGFQILEEKMNEETGQLLLRMKYSQ